MLIPKESNQLVQPLRTIPGPRSATSVRYAKPHTGTKLKPAILSPELVEADDLDPSLGNSDDLASPRTPTPKPNSKKRQEGLTAEKPAKEKRRNKASTANEDAEFDSEERIDLLADEEADEDAETDKSPSATEAEPRNKRRLVIGGILAMALTVAAFVLFGSSDENTAKSVAKLDPTAEVNSPAKNNPPANSTKIEEKKGTQGEKKGEEKKDDTKDDKKDLVDLRSEPEIAPPPRVSLHEPLPFTAARLFLERSDEPAEFDQKYRQRFFVVQGTCLSVGSESLVLSDDARAEYGEQRRGVILCTLPRIGQDGLPAGMSPPTWPKLQPGQPLTVRGTYLGWVRGDEGVGSLRLADCSVMRIGSPGDQEYGGKEFEVTGTVRQVIPLTDQSPVRFATLILEPTTTDSPITLRCLFRQTDQEGLSKLKPGVSVIVRAQCSGRSSASVTLHNCVLVTPQTPSHTPRPVRVSAEQLLAAYEGDMLPEERPLATAKPIPVSSAMLADRFAHDPKLAASLYRFKVVEVTGRIIERIPETRTVVLETGTNHNLLLAASFTPAQYATLPQNELRPGDAPLTFRGVCAGVGSLQMKKRAGRSNDETDQQAAVRIENAMWPQAQPASETLAEYFPTQAGHEHLFDVLTVTRAKDNPVMRLSVRCAEPDRFVATPLRSGTWPAATFFGDQVHAPKWLRDLTKPKVSPVNTITQHRLKDGVIEIREIPAPPNQPGEWWDPVFKLGVKKGESWSSELPDGRTVTYAVQNFAKDVANQPLVEIRRTLKNPKEPGVWEESKITYVLGIGEVSRVITKHSTTGQAMTIMELRRVDSVNDSKEPEKKNQGVVPTKATVQPK